MKIILLACLAVAPTAQGQVVVCPKLYTSTETLLSIAPLQHHTTGKGVLSQECLVRGRTCAQLETRVVGSGPLPPRSKRAYLPS